MHHTRLGDGASTPKGERHSSAGWLRGTGLRCTGLLSVGLLSVGLLSVGLLGTALIGCGDDANRRDEAMAGEDEPKAVAAEAPPAGASVTLSLDYERDQDQGDRYEADRSDGDEWGGAKGKAGYRGGEGRGETATPTSASQFGEPAAGDGALGGNVAGTGSLDPGSPDSGLALGNVVTESSPTLPRAQPAYDKVPLDLLQKEGKEQERPGPVAAQEQWRAADAEKVVVNGATGLDGMLALRRLGEARNADDSQVNLALEDEVVEEDEEESGNDGDLDDGRLPELSRKQATLKPRKPRKARELRWKAKVGANQKSEFWDTGGGRAQNDRTVDTKREARASGEEGRFGQKDLAALEGEVAQLAQRVRRGRSRLTLLDEKVIDAPGKLLPKQGGKRSGGDYGFATALTSEQQTVPDTFLPEKGYFENTYLGGSAAYREQLRRLDEALAGAGRPHRMARPRAQDFDSPDKAGLALSASLSTRWLDGPQRVFLQVGLKGSDRFGWRRPPLEMVLVVDTSALVDADLMRETISSLLRQLGPKDSLAVVLAGDSPDVVAPLGRLRTLRTSLLPTLDSLEGRSLASAGTLGQAMDRAGDILAEAAANRTTLPGTQTLLVLTGGNEPARVAAARASAHRLSVRGVVTSVVQTQEMAGATGWWSVANAGHGNFHSAVDGIDGAISAELEALARVVARLIRVNVKLAEGVKAVRILGSHMLDEQTVRQVKAREVATDRQLSRSLGIVADRGDDDDGLQTVIPYFYGGDAHVIVIELWVQNPGKVADVSLRYKDMVNVDNQSARTSVVLRNVPRDATGEQLLVGMNLSGYEVADTLVRAADLVAQDPARAEQLLENAAGRRVSADDRALLQRLNALVRSRPDAWTTASALRLAGQRKVGGEAAAGY